MTVSDRERFLRHLLWLQFHINVMASVAIEHPELRKHPILGRAAQ